HVAVDDPAAPSGRRVVHFQEYWVRLRAEVPARTVVVVGADRATPAPGVVEAIDAADAVVLSPSNPVVSIGTSLSVRGIRDALRSTPAPVVGLSPIVGGHHVRGMADQLLTALGVEVSSAAVAERYGARGGPDQAGGGVLDGWLVDSVDSDAVPRLEKAGIAAS